MTLSGGCLRGGDDGVALVWQAGTRWQAEPPTVLLPTGERLPVGTTFEAGGGFHGDDGPRTWVTDVEALVELERCSAATGTFVIQHPVVVTEG